MALQVGAPPFSGSGGAVKVGRRIYSYPAGSQVEYSEDRRGIGLMILRPPGRGIGLMILRPPGRGFRIRRHLRHH